MIAAKISNVEDGRMLSELHDGVVGIYKLFHLNEIVYIGRSDCVKTSINGHANERRIKFDAWSFITLHHVVTLLNYIDGQSYINWVEAHEVNVYKPKYNRRIHNLY
jgi:hypothetical protein